MICSADILWFPGDKAKPEPDCQDALRIPVASLAGMVLVEFQKWLVNRKGRHV